MRTILINNFLFLSFGLFYYFIGIFIKYLNLNIFESHLFTTFLVLFSFSTGNLLNIYDKIHPRDTLNNLRNLTIKEKLIIFFSCIPFYKLLILSYVFLDPIIINLCNSIRVGFNPILYCLYYKNFNLCNCIIIISIIFNIFGCIIPIIFNDSFIIKVNVQNLNLFGIFNTIISIVLTTICNIINEKFIYKYNFDNMYGLNTFITYTFVIVDIIFSILLMPFIILIYYLLNNNNLDNLIDLNNFYKIIFYVSIIGFFFGPYYIIITKSYLELKSLNICIINNIVLIFTIFISCFLKLSVFYYIYILAIVIILLSSTVITYKIEKLKNVI
jgi:hypothetical protein